MVYIPRGRHESFSRMCLFELLQSKIPFRPLEVKSKNILFEHIINTFGGEIVKIEDKKEVKKAVHTFGMALWRKWKESHGIMRRFMQKNMEWLDIVVITSGNVERASNELGLASRGRPKVSFAEGSQQTKRRRVKEIIDSTSKEELFLATQMKLFTSGHRDAAAVVRKISYSPKSATRIKNLEWKKNLESSSYSVDEALALFVSLKLTRCQYVNLRESAKRKNLKHLYPPYYKILEAKKKCYPSSKIVVTETSAEVQLQSLLDHTVSRIAEAQNEVLLAFNKTEPSINLHMFYKWGADGSGSQNNYNQHFQSNILNEVQNDDSSILTTSIVPLQLYYQNQNSKLILWQNPRSSSTRFCRPIRIQFIKENNDVIKTEFSYVENQIRDLTSTRLNINNTEIFVHHQLFKTMVDGKICNALTSNSSTQKCYICKAGPTEFNKLDKVASRTYDPLSFDFGISPLHAYIRCFECFLHISYREDFKKWQVRGDENKRLHSAKKQEIITSFRNEMDLLVDSIKPGFGTTNNGNTARTFFSYLALSSRITGIDQKLIYRFSVILKALSSNFKINSSSFGQYAYETALLYVKLYEWYPMPATVHEILLHGKDIIDHFLLPIGQLGEEAQESRHKDVKYFREHNTRKMSRKVTNEDLFNILLISSDPLISSMRILPPRHTGSINKDVIFLLESPEISSDIESD